MTPIIPPIWLYWFEALHGLNELLFVITILFTVVLIAYGIAAIVYYCEKGERIWTPKKWLCILFCFIYIFSIVAVILIPSQETMIYMAGLSFVTPDNVEYGVEVVKNVFDYVITALGMGENLTN